MDYSKLDAPLSAQLTLKSSDRTFPVFIRVSKDLGDQEQLYLKKMGIIIPGPKTRIFSANISDQFIDELSEQPWIRYIKLSTKLGLKG